MRRFVVEMGMGIECSPDSLIAIMLRDKKSVAGTLRFVLPSRIGRVDLVDGIDAAAVGRVLA